MSRRPAAITQADVTRALKAAANAGMKVGRVEIDPAGKLTIFSGEYQPTGEVTPLSEWRARRGSN
jgi:hypothetical protein